MFAPWRVLLNGGSGRSGVMREVCRRRPRGAGIGANVAGAGASVNRDDAHSSTSRLHSPLK
jgi:hypothetical protein